MSDDIENKIASRLCELPPAALKRRVLTAIHNETVSREKYWTGWRVVAASVAAVMIWFLPLLANPSPNIQLGGFSVSHEDRVVMMARLRTVFPEISEHEVRRQVLLNSVLGHAQGL